MVVEVTSKLLSAGGVKTMQDYVNGALLLQLKEKVLNL